MAFPSIAATNTNSDAATTNSATVNLPNGISTGDLLIAQVWINGTNAGAWATWPANWVELADEGGGPRHSIAYKIVDGTEGYTGTGDTIAVTWGGTARSSCSASLRITGWHGTTAPEISTKASGNGTSPDPGSLNPVNWGTEDTLWIATMVSDEDGATDDITGFPTGYTEDVQATEGNNGVISFCTETTPAQAASADPSAFALVNTQAWAAYTIGVRPSAAAAQSPVPIISNLTAPQTGGMAL